MPADGDDELKMYNQKYRILYGKWAFNNLFN